MVKSRQVCAAVVGAICLFVVGTQIWLCIEAGRNFNVNCDHYPKWMISFAVTFGLLVASFSIEQLASNEDTETCKLCLGFLTLNGSIFIFWNIVGMIIIFKDSKPDADSECAHLWETARLYFVILGTIVGLLFTGVFVWATLYTFHYQYNNIKRDFVDESTTPTRQLENSVSVFSEEVV